MVLRCQIHTNGMNISGMARQPRSGGDRLALDPIDPVKLDQSEDEMKPTNGGSAAMSDEAGRDDERSIQGLHGVRYQSTDVQRAADFYTTHLGFRLEHQQLPAFATVSLGGFKLLLSGPGASGSRPMPDGRRQEAGGWNRIVLHVTDVAREIERLKKAGVKFRNEMETGPAGRQIQIEDPDGNPIELFEPARR